MNDDTCALTAEFRGHPAVAGIPLEFVVSVPSKWKLNDTIILDRVHAFNRVGVSETRGTIMFESGHAFACLFAVSSKYPETMYVREWVLRLVIVSVWSCGRVAAVWSSGRVVE